MSEQFSVHSTRAKVVSVAFDNGISLADIMRTADLFSDSPFKRFYYINNHP